MSSNRPDRVGEQLRIELSELLAREVHDPGVGFVTLTAVKVSPDLQLARVYYTTMGDETARRETQKALARATPFLRRQVGQRIRLRRVPELQFFYDQSVAHTDRIEQILQDLKAEAASRTGESADEPERRDATGGRDASHENGAEQGAPATLREPQGRPEPGRRASETAGGAASAKPPRQE